MNIAVDIDDTLTDTFDYFIPFVAEYFGENADELRAKNISYSNLPQKWDILGFYKAYCDSKVAQTPFKDDALWGINRLKELGHKIIIITARTEDFYTDPYKTTVEELKNGHISYDKLICTLDKASACRDEQISVLIDDTLSNCDSVLKYGVSPILFSSKANREAVRDYPRADNWEQAVCEVAKLKK